MAGKVSFSVPIDRKLTEEAMEVFSEHMLTRSQVMRMLMAEIVREQELPDGLRITKETSSFLLTADTVPNTFSVDEDLKLACDRTLYLLHTDLPSVVAAFYVCVIRMTDSYFGVMQLMSSPAKICREVVSVHRKLLREFNEVIQEKGISMRNAITAFMRQTVETARPAPVRVSEKIIADLLGSPGAASMPSADQSLVTQQ